MADFLESEAEESEVDSEDEQQPTERKKPKRKATVQSDDEDEEEEDDEERVREELKDLIDDAPIDESGSDGEHSDASVGPKKRKKSDDELDDRLEDEDYDLIEENLGVKVARNKFKRLRRLEDDDSDNEGVDDPDLEREVIAEKLFVGGSDEEDENRSESAAPREVEYDYGSGGYGGSAGLGGGVGLGGGAGLGGGSGFGGGGNGFGGGTGLGTSHGGSGGQG